MSIDQARSPRIRFPTRYEQTISEKEQDQPTAIGEGPSLVNDESGEK